MAKRTTQQEKLDRRAELLRETLEWINPLLEEPVSWTDVDGIAATQVTYDYNKLLDLKNEILTELRRNGDE